MDDKTLEILKRAQEIEARARQESRLLIGDADYELKQFLKRYIEVMAGGEPDDVVYWFSDDGLRVYFLDSHDDEFNWLIDPFWLANPAALDWLQEYRRTISRAKNADHSIRYCQELIKRTEGELEKHREDRARLGSLLDAYELSDPRPAHLRESK